MSLDPIASTTTDAFSNSLENIKRGVAKSLNLRYDCFNLLKT